MAVADGTVAQRLDVLLDQFALNTGDPVRLCQSLHLVEAVEHIREGCGCKVRHHIAQIIKAHGADHGCAGAHLLQHIGNGAQRVVGVDIKRHAAFRFGGNLVKGRIDHFAVNAVFRLRIGNFKGKCFGRGRCRNCCRRSCVGCGGSGAARGAAAGRQTDGSGGSAHNFHERAARDLFHSILLLYGLFLSGFDILSNL